MNYRTNEGYIKQRLEYVSPVRYIKELETEIEKLNYIIKNLDKMFEFYYLGNLKYDQDTVNEIYIKYIKLKELKGSDK